MWKTPSVLWCLAAAEPPAQRQRPVLPRDVAIVPTMVGREVFVVGSCECDVPFACAVTSRARDVLRLAWRCALMVRPGGLADQPVSNVAYASGRGCRMPLRRRPAAGRGRGDRARRGVENAGADGEVVGAGGQCGREADCRDRRLLRQEGGGLSECKRRAWCWRRVEGSSWSTCGHWETAP